MDKLTFVLLISLPHLLLMQLFPKLYSNTCDYSYKYSITCKRTFLMRDKFSLYSQLNPQPLNLIQITALHVYTIHYMTQNHEFYILQIVWLHALDKISRKKKACWYWLSPTHLLRLSLSHFLHARGVPRDQRQSEGAAEADHRSTTQEPRM